MSTATAGSDPWQRHSWLLSLIWLIFLVYPVSALLDSDASPGLLVLGWAATGAFVAIYIAGFIVGARTSWEHTGRAVIVLFGMLLLTGLLTMPAIGEGALAFVPFAMSFASYAMRGLWHWAVNAGGVALVGATQLLTRDPEGHLQVLIVVVVLAVVNSITVWLIGRSITAGALRVSLAATQERAAVARDVHDLLGHSLTVITLKAQLALRTFDADPDRARAELAAIADISAEALTGVRRTVTEARSLELADQLALSRDALQSRGIRVEVQGEPETLSAVQSLTAAWVLREATTNILRHAAAQRVRIALRPGMLEIVDDGSGIGAATSETEGNGIRGMRERAGIAGGALRLENAKPHGTRVSLTW